MSGVCCWSFQEDGVHSNDCFLVQIKNKDAEIERLRDERDRLAYDLYRFESCYITLDETLKAKTREDEIERLREGYEQCRATLKHVAADRDEKEAEIERLRQELGRLVRRASGIHGIN